MSSSAEERLYSAYSFIIGVERNKALAALTLDHLLNEHIIAIEGEDPEFIMSVTGQTSEYKVSKLQRLETLKDDIDSLVSAVEEAGDDYVALAKIGLDVSEEDSEDTADDESAED